MIYLQWSEARNDKQALWIGGARSTKVWQAGIKPGLPSLVELLVVVMSVHACATPRARDRRNGVAKKHEDIDVESLSPPQQHTDHAVSGEVSEVGMSRGALAAHDAGNGPRPERHTGPASPLVNLTAWMPMPGGEPKPQSTRGII